MDAPSQNAFVSGCPKKASGVDIAVSVQAWASK